MMGLTQNNWIMEAGDFGNVMGTTACFLAR